MDIIWNVPWMSGINPSTLDADADVLRRHRLKSNTSMNGDGAISRKCGDYTQGASADISQKASLEVTRAARDSIKMNETVNRLEAEKVNLKPNRDELLASQTAMEQNIRDQATELLNIQTQVEGNQA